MSPTVAMILSQVENLPPRQRAQVALASLRLMDGPETESPASLKQKVAVRAAGVRAGTAKGRSVEVVLGELRRRFK